MALPVDRSNGSLIQCSCFRRHSYSSLPDPSIFGSIGNRHVINILQHNLSLEVLEERRVGRYQLLSGFEGGGMIEFEGYHRVCTPGGFFFPV